MRVLKIWLLALLIAATVLGLLSVTDVLVGSDLRAAARMTVLAIIVLASAHYAWSVLRGRANPADHTDKPVP
jgi:hypothetical protein